MKSTLSPLGYSTSFLAIIALASPAFASDEAPAVSLIAAQNILPRAPECSAIPCTLAHAYRADPEAAAAALALWSESGDVAGVGEEEELDGGFRGAIRLMPELPVRGYRKHLEWVLAGTRGIDHFFDALFANQPAPSYRFRALEFRFARSVNKHRPSAYTAGWSITYNVEGSLNLSAKAVEETLFHELFHANDDAHGDWSVSHLKQDYVGILLHCGPKLALKCLAPYAPNDTTVRGGTYYAFQQNNGDTVHEYAAELAVRYFKEQRAMLAGGKLTHAAFKCGPRENARAWQALVHEFFADRDLVPICSSAH